MKRPTANRSITMVFAVGIRIDPPILSEIDYAGEWFNLRHNKDTLCDAPSVK
jgi:hypothetical protein